VLFGYCWVGVGLLFGLLFGLLLGCCWVTVGSLLGCCWDFPLWKQAEQRRSELRIFNNLGHVDRYLDGFGNFNNLLNRTGHIPGDEMLHADSLRTWVTNGVV
jgi:hypothetical protein